MLPAEGMTTASANAVATAASTALPPAASICWPTWVARAASDETMPRALSTGLSTAGYGHLGGKTGRAGLAAAAGACASVVATGGDAGRVPIGALEVGGEPVVAGAEQLTQSASHAASRRIFIAATIPLFSPVVRDELSREWPGVWCAVAQLLLGLRFGLAGRLPWPRASPRAWRPPCRRPAPCRPAWPRACPGAVLSAGFGHLDELERHAIALADRDVLLLVLVAEAQRRRQRPDALGVVLGVLRVRVDLGLARELEAGGLDLLDDPLLRQVALLRALVGVGVRLRAVLLDAEDAVRLERLVDLGEPRVELAVVVPCRAVARMTITMSTRALGRELRRLASRSMTVSTLP